MEGARYSWNVIVAGGQFDTPDEAKAAILAALHGTVSGVVIGPTEAPDGTLVMLIPSTIATAEQMELQLSQAHVRARVRILRAASQ